MNTRTLSQAQSVPIAENVGKGWTSAELEMVRETAELPILEVAEVLARTVYGVEKVRELMARGVELTGSDRSANHKTVAIVVCPECNLTMPIAGACC